MKKNLLLILAATFSLSLVSGDGDIDFSSEIDLARHLGKQFDLNEADWKNYTRSGSTNPVTDVFYNIPITNTKLSTSSSTAGIELVQSGRYYLANNLRRGIAADIPYVLISGKNVVLDMNGTTIQGDLQTTSTSASGITINNNAAATAVNNIRIINGGVTTISGTGINVGTGVDTVAIETVKVSKFKTSGIRFQGNATSNVYMSNVNVSTSNSPSGAAYGLEIAYTSADTTNGLVENCSFNNVSSATTTTAAGVSLSGVSDFTFRNCSANGNSGDDFVYGFALQTQANTSNRFVNCEATGNTSSTTTAADMVAGFAQPLAANNNNRFENCIANGNNITGAANATIAAGFYSLASQGLIYEGCKANANTNGSAGGITNGFRLASTDAVTFGTSNTINNCEASGNYTSIAAHTGRVVGIELGDYEQLSTVSNCTLVGNAYTGIAAATAGAGSIYGILFGTTTQGVNRCSALKNTVRSTGIPVYATAVDKTVAGLRDFTADSTSLISGNVLALNGYARLSIGSAPNYNILASDLLADNDQGGLNIYLTYSNGQNVADIVVETDVSNMQALSTGLEGWTNYLIVPGEAS
jgi:hypothetical protein